LIRNQIGDDILRFGLGRNHENNQAEARGYRGSANAHVDFSLAMSEQGGKPFEGISEIGGTFPELHSKGRPVATRSCQAFVTNLQILLAQ
jgi:hypothetical protein